MSPLASEAIGWWGRYRRWRLRNVRRLALTHDGFTFIASAGNVRTAWCDIEAVTAFKRDLMTTDLLCLAISTPTGMVEIDEEMPGYADVEAQLCARLGMGETWKLGVLFPAFELQATSLYTRTASAAG